MIKVDQTLFGNGKGNCFAACVATILGLKIEEVPNFCVDHDDKSWYNAFIKWLEERQLAPISFSCAGDDKTHLDWCMSTAPNIPWIAGGPTSRGMHSCIYIGNRLYHDPNPNDRVGLMEVTDITYILSENLPMHDMYGVVAKALGMQRKDVKMKILSYLYPEEAAAALASPSLHSGESQ